MQDVTHSCQNTCGIPSRVCGTSSEARKCFSLPHREDTDRVHCRVELGTIISDISSFEEKKPAEA